MQSLTTATATGLGDPDVNTAELAHVVTHEQESHSAASEPSTKVVSAIADLTAIFEPHISVLVLRRPLQGELADDVRKVVSEPSFRGKEVITPDARGRRVLAGILPDLPHLSKEVFLWVDVLAELTGCEFVGLRFLRMTAAMCPRFHVDNVTLRLVQTFDGPGTEYLANADVDRRWMGTAAKGQSDAASGLIRSPDRVRQADVGDIVLLKGEAWPDNEGRGAVHRSPAVSPCAPRLMMTLDPLD